MTRFLLKWHFVFMKGALQIKYDWLKKNKPTTTNSLNPFFASLAHWWSWPIHTEAKVLYIYFLVSNCPVVKIITQPGWFAVSMRGEMQSCKQTDSCLHRSSAAFSIFNSVHNSLRAGGGGRNVWFRTHHIRSMLKFADRLIFLQNGCWGGCEQQASMHKSAKEGSL